MRVFVSLLDAAESCYQQQVFHPCLNVYPGIEAPEMEELYFDKR